MVFGDFGEVGIGGVQQFVFEGQCGVIEVYYGQDGICGDVQQLVQLEQDVFEY